MINITVRPQRTIAMNINLKKLLQLVLCIYIVISSGHQCCTVAILKTPVADAKSPVDTQPQLEHYRTEIQRAHTLQKSYFKSPRLYR